MPNDTATTPWVMPQVTIDKCDYDVKLQALAAGHYREGIVRAPLTPTP